MHHSITRALMFKYFKLRGSKTNSMIAMSNLPARSVAFIQFVVCKNIYIVHSCLPAKLNINQVW